MESAQFIPMSQLGCPAWMVQWLARLLPTLKILGSIPGMSEEYRKLFIRTNCPVHSAAEYTLIRVFRVEVSLQWTCILLLRFSLY